MTDFDIGIHDFRSIGGGYSVYINGKLAIDNMKKLEDVVKEIKKYLRLRFKEPLK